MKNKKNRMFDFTGRRSVLRIAQKRSGKDREDRRKLYKGNQPLTVKQADQAYNQVRDIMAVFNATMSEYYRLEDDSMLAVFEQLRVRHEMLKLHHLSKFPRTSSRSPQMYYQDYLRGWVMEKYLQCRVLPAIFPGNSEIRHIGDDTSEEFLRTHKADCEVVLASHDLVRVEIQTGLGDNLADLKEAKVREAQHQMEENHIETVVLHLDMVDGFAILVRGADQILGPFETRPGYDGLVWDMRHLPVWRWVVDPVSVWSDLPRPTEV